MNYNRPRIWKDEEVRLVKAVAERTWAASLRTRAEAEHKVGEARLRAIPDALPIGVAAAYGPSGCVLLGNGAVEVILRHPVLPSADIASHRDREAYHEDGRLTEVHGHPNTRVLVTSERAGGRRCYRRGDRTMAWVRPNTAPI